MKKINIIYNNDLYSYKYSDSAALVELLTEFCANVRTYDFYFFNEELKQVYKFADNVSLFHDYMKGRTTAAGAVNGLIPCESWINRIQEEAARGAADEVGNLNSFVFAGVTFSAVKSGNREFKIYGFESCAPFTNYYTCRI